MWCANYISSLILTGLISYPGTAVSGGAAYARYANTSEDSLRIRRIETAYNVRRNFSLSRAKMLTVFHFRRALLGGMTIPPLVASSVLFSYLQFCGNELVSLIVCSVTVLAMPYWCHFLSSYSRWFWLWQRCWSISTLWQDLVGRPTTKSRFCSPSSIISILKRIRYVLFPRRASINSQIIFTWAEGAYVSTIVLNGDLI